MSSMGVIGIDVGGTNIRLVEVNESGSILAKRRVPTLPERGAADTVNRIVESIELMILNSSEALSAVGLGITGPVDILTGVVSNPFTLEGWPSTDLRAPLVAAFEIPVVIDNDANVAALGEWWRGAGMNSNRMTMVTIGTGVGVATLIDGQVQRTSEGRHGEAGHMVLDASGPQCYCGARGCWEVLASGTALGKQAVKLAANVDGALRRLAGGNPEQANGALLFAAAAAGDSSAQDLLDAFADRIGLGLVNLASTVMPDLFVFSGGVMEHLHVLQPRIADVLHRHKVMIPTEIPMKVARLGDDAGAVGAAKLALDLAHK